MSRILISPDDLKLICSHAEEIYPEECCGFLMGHAVGELTRIERILLVTNEWEDEDSRHKRYLIHPEIVFEAHKEARAMGLDVVGYYHSHPDHPARPSEFDREHAWPGLSYVIVSVQGGKVAEARSWRLSDDRDRFEEEAVEKENSK
ncbi:MAG TPA: M67 family metallopeptidase [Thermoanaerobaculia bacterium]|nr:M67 family metallopeptidase [Thermoanaerobaculia bacterium]